MLQSRRTRLCREGWHYLLVLAFVVVGAVSKQVNLLVALAALMAAPLLFNWRYVVWSRSRLSVQRRLPHRIAAGDPLVVDLEVRVRGRSPCWSVVVEDSVALEGAASSEWQRSVEAFVPRVAPEGPTACSYRCLLTRRGRYRFGPIRVSTRFPFGLIRGEAILAQEDTITVFPRLGRLTPRWQHLLDDSVAGVQKANPRRGLIEGEFYGMREWRSGDSRRWIHWRTSAKLDQLAVRQFEQQRTRNLALMLDLWQDKQPTPRQLENVELAVSLAASAAADLCRRGRGHLTLAAAGMSDFYHSARASAAQLPVVLERLATVEAGDADKLPELLGRVLDEQPGIGRTIVVSTRPARVGQLSASAAWRGNHRRAAALSRVMWIDVSGEQLPEFFHAEPAIGTVSSIAPKHGAEDRQ